MSKAATQATATRDQRRRDNHDRLFQAALDEFERVGYEQARIEHICQKSEVTRPTFYAHFASKEGVLSELQLRQFETLAVDLNRRTATGLELDGMIDALVDACFETTALISERLLREAVAFLPRHQRMSAWVDTEVFAILAHSFDQAQRRREIAPCDPRELASDVFCVINGFISAEPGDLKSAAEAARRTLRIYLQGLRVTTRSQRSLRGAA